MTRKTSENTVLEFLSKSWELRLELYVKKPICKLTGQKTSSELIAEAFNKGVNRKKLDQVIAEMEALADELENRGRDRKN